MRSRYLRCLWRPHASQTHHRRTPQVLFAHTSDEEIDPNIVTFTIQPNEGISICFGAKRPGPEMKTAPVQASFFYKSVFGTASPAAYETSLLDAMQGETMLFTRRDEVEAEWRIITSIEETWTQLSPPNFPNYAAGSDGPVAGDALIAGDHKGWRKLAEDPKNGK